MFPSAYILLLLAQPAGLAHRDEIRVTLSANSLDLGWSDVEDRIQGAITPRLPIEGQPIEVTAHVGTFQGPEFDGPVTFSLKPAGATSAETHTVKRAPGEKAWKTGFVPRVAGNYTLEISFQTTRMKVASATIEVDESTLPRWPWWVMVVVFAVTAVALGIRSVLKKPENL